MKQNGKNAVNNFSRITKGKYDYNYATFILNRLRENGYIKQGMITRFIIWGFNNDPEFADMRKEVEEKYKAQIGNL